MKRLVWLTLLLLIVVGQTLAQADCPAIVETALQNTTDACTELSRNQACYGNDLLEAEASQGTQISFDTRGDIADLRDIAALHLSPMDTTAEQWGVAMLLTQANLPDDAPAQNVTLILFGGVDITSAVPSEAEVTPEPRPIVFIATAASSINIRSAPSTSGAVISSLAAGESLPTDGRNADSTWLRVLLEDGSVGWVFAELVTVDGDVSQLRTLTGDEPVATEAPPPAPVYAPMQAFYFTTGTDDAPCVEASDSGILIQTPEGVGEINFLINEVDIRLGSTAYLQAGDGEMTVSVIEGQGSITALDTTVTVPAGTRTRIPLDENNAPSDVPVDAEPYDENELAALPISLLPEEITVATPLTEEEIAASTTLQEGDWTLSYSLINSCTPNEGSAEGSYPLILVGTEFEYPEGGPFGSSYPLTFFADEGVRIPGEYTREVVFEGGRQNIVMNVLSGTEIVTVIVSSFAGNDCVETATYTYTADE